MALTATQHVAKQIRARRGRRTQAELAQRITELGGRGWTQSKVAKLETGKIKSITLDEFLLLALALDVAPVQLYARDDEVAITTAVVVPADLVRRWDRGYEPLPQQDAVTYFTEVSTDERARAEELLRVALADEGRRRGAAGETA